MPEPNFFIVGAPKCGTSSLHDYLRQHPDVFMPERKEPKYYGRDLQFDPSWCVRDRDEYLALFADAGSARRIGEASVYYLYSRQAAEEIHRDYPDAKILIMLRDPAEMVFSLHGQFLWNCHEDIVDFEEAFAAQDDRKQGRRLPPDAVFPQGLYYSDIAAYTEQVRRYQEIFPSDQVLVLIFDDLVRDPAAVYRQVLEFLDLPWFEASFRQVNPAKPVLMRQLNRFILQSPRLHALVSAALPASLRDRIRQALPRLMPGPRPPKLTPATRARLAEHFRPEIERLGALLDRDLSHWYRRAVTSDA